MATEADELTEVDLTCSDHNGVFRLRFGNVYECIVGGETRTKDWLRDNPPESSGGQREPGDTYQPFDRGNG